MWQSRSSLFEMLFYFRQWIFAHSRLLKEISQRLQNGASDRTLSTASAILYGSKQPPPLPLTFNPPERIRTFSSMPSHPREVELKSVAVESVGNSLQSSPSRVSSCQRTLPQVLRSHLSIARRSPVPPRWTRKPQGGHGRVKGCLIYKPFLNFSPLFKQSRENKYCFRQTCWKCV